MPRTCPLCGRQEHIASEQSPFVCPGCGTTVDAEVSNDEQRAAALARVRVPSLGLIISGTLALLGGLEVATFVMFEVFFEHGSVARGVHAVTDADHLPMLLAGGLSPIVGPLLIIGGRNMRSLRSRRWAIIAAVAAFVPSSAALLSAPFGVWSVIVLTRPGVKAAFEQRSCPD